LSGMTPADLDYRVMTIFDMVFPPYHGMSWYHYELDGMCVCNGTTRVRRVMVKPGGLTLPLLIQTDFSGCWRNPDSVCASKAVSIQRIFSQLGRNSPRWHRLGWYFSGLMTSQAVRQAEYRDSCTEARNRSPNRRRRRQRRQETEESWWNR